MNFILIKYIHYFKCNSFLLQTCSSSMDCPIPDCVFHAQFFCTLYIYFSPFLDMLDILLKPINYRWDWVIDMIKIMANVQVYKY